MSRNSGPSSLRVLANLITEAVDQIESTYAAHSVPLPELDEFGGAVPDVARKPEVARATAILVSACRQLEATIEIPNKELVRVVYGYVVTDCVDLAIKAHVAEALRPAGKEGLHVDEIAKYSVVNPDKLARCLRTLATNYIFREVSPNVFAYNRLSAGLDTGKDAKDLGNEKDPAQWFVGTDGTAAVYYLGSDIVHRAALELPAVLADPALANSYSSAQAPVSRMIGKEVNLYEWLREPQNTSWSSIFDVAMIGGEHACGQPNFILDEGLGWDKLSPGSTVVDVGGGVGTCLFVIGKRHKHLKFVVQDLPAVIDVEAKKFWNLNDPAAIEEGRVQLMSHSFFEPNPVKGAAVYLVHQVIHNWPDDEAVKILRQLCDAANAESKIVLTNFLLLPATETLPNDNRLRSLNIRPSPKPLLANLGPVSNGAHFLDLTMLSLFNALQRTADQWVSLTGRAGLKIDDVVGDPTHGTLVHIVCSRA